MVGVEEEENCYDIIRSSASEATGWGQWGGREGSRLKELLSTGKRSFNLEGAPGSGVEEWRLFSAWEDNDESKEGKWICCHKFLCGEGLLRWSEGWKGLQGAPDSMWDSIKNCVFLVIEELYILNLFKLIFVWNLQYCWKQCPLWGLLSASEKIADCWMKETWVSQVWLGSSSMNHAISYLELGHMRAKDALMKRHTFTLLLLPLSSTFPPPPPPPSSLPVTLSPILPPLLSLSQVSHTKPELLQYSKKGLE